MNNKQENRKHKPYHSRNFLVENLERLKELKSHVSGVTVEDLVNQCVSLGLEKLEQDAGVDTNGRVTKLYREILVIPDGIEEWKGEHDERDE